MGFFFPFFFFSFFFFSHEKQFTSSRIESENSIDSSSTKNDGSFYARSKCREKPSWSERDEDEDCVYIWTTLDVHRVIVIE